MLVRWNLRTRSEIIYIAVSQQITGEEEEDEFDDSLIRSQVHENIQINNLTVFNTDMWLFRPKYDGTKISTVNLVSSGQAAYEDNNKTVMQEAA